MNRRSRYCSRLGGSHRRAMRTRHIGPQAFWVPKSGKSPRRQDCQLAEETRPGQSWPWKRGRSREHVPGSRLTRPKQISGFADHDARCFTKPREGTRYVLTTPKRPVDMDSQIIVANHIERFGQRCAGSRACAGEHRLPAGVRRGCPGSLVTDAGYGNQHNSAWQSAGSGASTPVCATAREGKAGQETGKLHRFMGYDRRIRTPVCPPATVTRCPPPPDSCTLAGILSSRCGDSSRLGMRSKLRLGLDLRAPPCLRPSAPACSAAPPAPRHPAPAMGPELGPTAHSRRILETDLHGLCRNRRLPHHPLWACRNNSATSAANCAAFSFTVGNSALCDALALTFVPSRPELHQPRLLAQRQTCTNRPGASRLSLRKSSGSPVCCSPPTP